MPPNEDRNVQESIQLARLEEKFSYLRMDFEDMTAQMKLDRESSARAAETMKRQLDEVLTTLSEARGGWRTLMKAGGAVAALGGLVGWASTHVKFF